MYAKKKSQQTSASEHSNEKTCDFVSTFQTITQPDRSAVATYTPSWLNPTQVTESLCPVNWNI